MKKRIIRILTVALLVCFGMTLFAACNNGGEGGGETKKTYTVTYEANEGTRTAPRAESYEEGKTFTVKENMFTREGYTFKTWNDGTNDVAAGSTYTMPAKNVTFTAQWEKGSAQPEPAKKVTVTYSLGDNTEGKAPAAVEVESGKEVTLPAAPTWGGYTFKGWKVGDDVTLKQAGDKITVTADVTVTAQWEKIPEPAKKVTVTYSLGDYTDGKVPAAVEVESGKEVTLPEAPAWEGHTFKGWKVGTETALKQAGTKITVTADVTVTAQWEVLKEQVEVSFDLGEHSVESAYEPEMADKGEEYELPEGPVAKAAPHFDKGAWSGYLFAGWKIGETEEIKQPGDTITPDANVKLTAQWKEVGFVVTGAKLEASESVMYVSVSGTYTGFTAEEFIAANEDSNDSEISFCICLGMSPWTYQDVECTVTAENGEFTAKLDVTDSLEKDTPYSVLADNSGYGDIKTLTVEATETLGSKKYTLRSGSGSGLTLTIGDATKEYAFTGMKLEAETDKVYVIVNGTYSGYTDAEFKGLLEDSDKYVLSISLCIGHDSYTYQEPTITLTVEGGKFTAKIDVTAFEYDYYSILENRSGRGDIPWNEEAFSSTVTLNGKKYTIEKQWAGNTQLKVEAAPVPQPPVYSEPTSVTLEVIKSDGREEGKLFREEVDAAFIVFSGTYTGDATEADAKDYFSQAKYSFKFITKEQKDRLRRISIDTEKKTWTLKIDITPLPAIDNKCVLKDADLKLEIPETATKEVKALGSTFSIKNGEDGTLIVNVKHNYTVSNVDLVNENGKPLLVMTGTYEEGVWTGEDIVKFFKDDDIRTLSLNLVAYIWPMNDTYNVEVTAENGEYTVKLDISNVGATGDAGTGVLSEASGFGDITTVTVDKTIEVGGKTYQLVGKAGSKLLLIVTVK